MSDLEGGDAVRLDIMKKYAPAFEAVFLKHGLTEEAEALMDGFKHYGAEYSEMELHSTWPEQVLVDLEEAATGYRGVKGQIRGFRVVALNPAAAKVDTPAAFYEATVKYLATDVLDGWIYKLNLKDQVLEAYVLTKVLYFKERIHGSKRDQQREPPYVRIYGKANTAACGDHYEWKGVEERTWTFGEDECTGTVPEILFEKGLQKETPELRKEYTEATERFEKFQPMASEQFWARGKVWPAVRDRWSSHDNDRDTWDLGDGSAKVVNDETMLRRHFTRSVNASFWRDRGVEEGFDRVPIHPYVYCFDLNRHENCWVNVLNMEMYQYDLTLREKIILPPNHRDLVEILTTDLDIFTEVGDVIKGKSGGTAILCMGEPGLGKTLTAEVYGELRKRPLYKVHSGQLGIQGDEVEKSLEIVLKRAERWNAVLLIDEADVFIRRRGDDVNHNAIVAAFLRTLEYFHGLLFLTTNRSEDVDDAIISRMMAIFKYELPSKEDAAKIWRVMANEFKVELPDEIIEELIKQMRLTGRDIKQLLKLTMKYVDRKKVPLDFEAFRICAMFRGVA